MWGVLRLKRYIRLSLIISLFSVFGLSPFANAQGLVKDLVKKVNPSVVAIIGEDKTLNNETIDDYYYSKIPSGLMHGSGVIVSKDGRIITNNHVVQDMKEIYVVLFDKRAFKAKLLYNNKDIDLALIKIDCKGLKPIIFEKQENISAGDDVIAIGTPLNFGWSNSVSKGIISGLNRPIEETYTFLQTDVSINPGNSGGPLINMDGKLVGINTMGILESQGLNFSIPVENVVYLINQYNRFGKIRRPYTGLEFEESWLAMVGIPTSQGLKVIGIKGDSAVPKGKIKEGDILEYIDGKSITSIANYNEILKKKIPGDKVVLKLSRGSKKISVTIKLKEYQE
jgi:2-alkenal reductase